MDSDQKAIDGSKVNEAMAAGVTKRLWEMSDVVNVLEAWEATHEDGV